MARLKRCRPLLVASTCRRVVPRWALLYRDEYGLLEGFCCYTFGRLVPLVCRFVGVYREKEKIGDVRGLPWTDRSSREEVACHQEIAAYVREHVLRLEAVARRDYYGDDSPYSTVE